jgi:hypothetical protein
MKRAVSRRRCKPHLRCNRSSACFDRASEPTARAAASLPCRKARAPSAPAWAASAALCDEQTGTVRTGTVGLHPAQNASLLMTGCLGGCHCPLMNCAVLPFHLSLPAAGFSVLVACGSSGGDGARDGGDGTGAGSRSASSSGASGKGSGSIDDAGGGPSSLASETTPPRLHHRVRHQSR